MGHFLFPLYFKSYVNHQVNGKMPAVDNSKTNIEKGFNKDINHFVSPRLYKVAPMIIK